MNPIESLRYLDAHATPAPWEEGNANGKCIVFQARDGYHFPGGLTLYRRANLLLTEGLRNLAPEILALWEASNAFREAARGTAMDVLDASRAHADALHALNEKALSLKVEVQ